MEDFYNIPLYYINLDSSVDRNKYMIEKYSNKFKNMQRVQAVDGSKITNIKNCDSSPYELACYKSHMKAIKRAYDEENRDYALIAEDDLYLNEDYVQKYYKSLIAMLPEDWEILQLVCSNKKKMELLQLNSFTKFTMGNWGTLLYLINKKGMNSVLNSKTIHMDGNKIVADHALYRACNTYTVSPSFQEDNFDNYNSTIIREKTKKRHKTKERIIYA
jgi:GR25 family glycosyltransferase involved in LPS biosynthesis